MLAVLRPTTTEPPLERSNHDLRDDDIDLRTRFVGLDWDFSRIGRNVRASGLESAQRLDGRLYLDNSGNQRDWVLFSLPSLFAIPCYRHHFAAIPCGCHLRALRYALGFRVPADFPHPLHYCTL